MQLVRFDPFTEMQKLDRSLDRVWDKTMGMMPAITETMAMDMYEEGGNLVTELSLPNFSKEEVKVKAEEGMLEVSAEHTDKAEDKSKRRYFMQESSSHYYRRVTLPEGANTDKADATFKDGKLTITMPMTSHKKKSKELTVK